MIATDQSTGLQHPSSLERSKARPRASERRNCTVVFLPDGRVPESEAGLVPTARLTETVYNSDWEGDTNYGNLNWHSETWPLERYWKWEWGMTVTYWLKISKMNWKRMSA